MKSGFATSLSLVGVLATGGAALVLNSSILDTASATKGSPALATVVGLEVDSGASAVGGSVGASSAAALITGHAAGDAPLTPPEMVETSDEPHAVVPSSTVPTAPSVDRQFKVADVATITLTVTGRQLLVKSVVFTSGSEWNVTNESSNDGDDVRITLGSTTRSINFSARLVNGQVVAAIGSPSSGNLMPPRPPHHDDDHDDRGDDDHDEGREHHEQREHEREDDDD